tara:strand:+ start:3277 stop:4425 length:1149 start_codon:yes stop_codon:yes gene_type:complete
MSQGISFAQFSKIAPYIIRGRKPIMGHGRHGIGKSELVYQLAPDLVKVLDLEDKYGKDYVYPVVERRASQMADTGDVIGVPEPETNEFGRVTKFAPMAWFAQACSQPCILFFDEVDRANNDVRQSLMELCDSRKIAGHHLHPDTIIVAMVNGGSHDQNNSYQVSELDPAEHDRWWHCDLEPTIEDWLIWGKENCHPMTVDFIRQNSTHLEFAGDLEPHKVYPSRRSWAHFDKCLHLALGNGENFFEKDSMEIYFIGEGYVGKEASIAFKDFIENYSRQVTVEDVLDGGKAQLIADLELNRANALIDKIADSKEFKENMSDERNLNLARFIHGISAELAMKAWERFTLVNPDSITAMWEKEINEDGLTFGNYIAKIAGNNSEE